MTWIRIDIYYGEPITLLMVPEKLVLDRATQDFHQLIEKTKIFSMSSKMLVLSFQPVLGT